MDEKGIVFNIQRFSVNDGPGIRTCVFMKGCLLDCVWCHNPESKSFRPELSFSEEQCIKCGRCVQVCPNGCHSLQYELHKLDRIQCQSCGACAEVCVGALELLGKEMTASTVIAQVCKDREFYGSTGGVTFTGGEPFAQPLFLLAMLKEAKRQQLHTCMETSGFVNSKLLASAAPYIDLFLFDYKETDSERHLAFTGVDNHLILENLDYLAMQSKPIVLRCPMIPGYNSRPEHLKGIAALANRYPSIIRIDVEPYHPLGQKKACAIGKTYRLSSISFADKKQVDEWIATIQSQTPCPVCRA